MRALVPTLIFLACAQSAVFAQTPSDQCAAQTAETAAPRTLRGDPASVVIAANAAARQHPNVERFRAARQIYAYAPGAIFELYASPSYVSLILLEPGESLVQAAAGDTARWQISEIEGESEGEGRTIVLVKPAAGGLRTNIVLITNRRRYNVEAIARAGDVYLAEIAWCYAQATPSEPIGPAALNRAYRIRLMRGPRPDWMPVAAYDDGRRTWIEFPQGIEASDMVPLFVVGGEGSELVNCRVQGSRIMVDQVFDRAELTLGVRAPIVVRIDRAPPSMRPGRGR